MTERSEEVQRLLKDIAALELIEDDETCMRVVTELLNELPTQQARLRELRQDRVRRLRDRGKTWKEIGDVMGIHFTRAQQIGAGKRGSKREGEPSE